MAEIKLMIRGVHFHVHPNLKKGQKSTDDMELRTEARLKELDEKKPEIILMPEPDNQFDPKAIRAWCKGSPIGYVAHEELDDAHRLFDATRDMVEAKIVSVEVRPRGNFCVKAELPERALLKKKVLTDTENAWKQWKCNIPDFPLPDAWRACQVAEYKIDKFLLNPKEEDIEELIHYVEVWKKQSLHDLSGQTMKKRNDFIVMLRATKDERLIPLAQKLEKQRTALCSDHRSETRMEWWKELQQSEQMEHYWDKWRSGRKEDNLWCDLHEVDVQLRRMPDGLYAKIGDLQGFFSALHYRDDVPRSVLFNIYSLLLLRERICRELGIAMKPLPENAYGVETDGEENYVLHPELTDLRLLKAIEEHQPYFWGKSAYAVVFCVCRDYFGIAGNVSAFEKRIQTLIHSKEVEECPSGTIQKTLGNNAYMKKSIDKWEEGRALVLATRLKSFLEGVS